jgi:hypothetical protein
VGRRAFLLEGGDRIIYKVLREVNFTLLRTRLREEGVVGIVSRDEKVDR